jgi:hypothetical protein
MNERPLNKHAFSDALDRVIFGMELALRISLEPYKEIPEDQFLDLKKLAIATFYYKNI